MWTYDPTNISDATDEGKLNAVRLLVGDTDTTDKQLQDEELYFALNQSRGNIYRAAYWAAGVLYSKYARLVNTELDEAIRVDYSDLADNYKAIRSDLKMQMADSGIGGLRLFATGISQAEIEAARENTDRPQSTFYRDKFSHYGLRGHYLYD